MTKIVRIGVDEVGRGPLAGPVTVCAFGVPHNFDMHQLAGITDSKQLTPQARNEWALLLRQARQRGEVAYCIASVGAQTIDRVGIAQALRRAVARSLRGLEADPQQTDIRLDGALHAPQRYQVQQTIIKGDVTEPLISAASVLAKVHRDAYMVRQAKEYPVYGFEQHKGYGTSMHREAIRRHGASALHRKSFCTAFV